MKDAKVISDKLKRIDIERERLKNLFSDMPVSTMDKTISLIDNAAFMTITLQDLQDHINKNGAISEYQNGLNQWGTKKSPEVEVYNTMLKNHMNIIKQLTDLMPCEIPIPKKEPDAFEAIMRRGKVG